MQREAQSQRKKVQERERIWLPDSTRFLADMTSSKVLFLEGKSID